MKTNKLSIALMSICTLALLASCEDIKKNELGDEEENTDTSLALTADEQKDYLMKTGKEFLNTFKTIDQKDEVDLVEGLIYKLDHYDWNFEAFENYADEGIDALFVMPRYVLEVASGKRSPVAAPTYTYSFANNSGLFEADEKTHKWTYTKTTDNCVTVRMKSYRNSQCEAKCWAEGTTKRMSHSYYAGEKSEVRYEYCPEYAWVGAGNGDYSWQYNYNTYNYGYTYVGPGNGDYIEGVTYVRVGEGHGSYKCKYDGYYYYSSENPDAYYDFVGPGNGDHDRKTHADAMYSWQELDYSPWWTYKYDAQNGEYVQYTRYWMDYEETWFEGAEERVIAVDVPETIRFTFKEGNNTIVDATVNLDLKENDHYNVSASYQLANLKWQQSAQVNYQSANVNVAMQYGNKSMYTVKVNVPSYDMFKKQSEESYEEYGERIEDRWESLVNEVGEVVAEVDLINKVQIKARVSNVGNLYNAYDNWEREYDAEIGDDLSKDAADALRGVYNKYCLAGIYYNSDVVQAKMQLNTYAVEHYYGRRSYDIEPVIYFPKDGTSYAYGDYFTESRFGNLIDLAEDVTNNYIKLLKYYRDDVDVVDLR